MKILVCHRPGGAFGFISDSWINAFRDKGHIAQRWDGNEQSWYKFNPDLYIGCSGHKQPIPHERSAKVAIHVNPYGPTVINGVNESQDSIRWVLNQKPDVVFGYGQEEDALLWSYWTTKHGIKWIPQPTAGDKTLFSPSKEIDKVYDIVYLGGRWQYKGITIDEYLVPVLRNSKSYKLHGWGDWPNELCSGILADDKVCKFLGSGKVGPCMSELHTQEYGIDIPERAFKIALCNTMIVHDSVIQIKKMIPSAIVASNAEQFKEYCLYFSDPAQDEERRELAAQQRKEVITSHTYHNRMSSLLSSVGFDKEAELMLA
jgi:hypothetical protein